MNATPPICPETSNLDPIYLPWNYLRPRRPLPSTQCWAIAHIGAPDCTHRRESPGLVLGRPCHGKAGETSKSLPAPGPLCLSCKQIPTHISETIALQLCPPSHSGTNLLFDRIFPASSLSTSQVPSSQSLLCWGRSRGRGREGRMEPWEQSERAPGLLPRVRGVA